MTATLRGERERMLADTDLRGRAYGRAMSALIDGALTDAAAALNGDDWAVIALGSLARGELCPGSDVDVMLLHSRKAGRGSSRLADDASAIWYPLWDAGFVLGQSTRTVNEAVAVADEDTDALTAQLDMRVVAGNPELAAQLAARMRQLGIKRRKRLVDFLAASAKERFERPGPVAEMLEPNLKDGAGGLRDIQALGWAGLTLDPVGDQVAQGWEGGVGTLVARGYLRPDGPERLARARDVLLDVRVALHRVTGRRSDQLTLQEQDAVADLLGMGDADLLVREIADAARAVVWITADAWTRLASTEKGPGGRSSGVRVVGDGLVVRDGRVALQIDEPLDATHVLRVAEKAAELDAPIDPDTLERIADLHDVEWTPAARDAFVGLLAAGRPTVAVMETLDQIGVLVRLLPEWEHVRARPQRNAYHRFTIDRHLLEAVVECARLLVPEPGRNGADDAAFDAAFDADVARRCRLDLLLLGGLLHDIGKGRPEDHSEIGSRLAGEIARRIGTDEHGVALLEWLVANHLLLAETATRRDLGDEMTVVHFGREVERPEKLDLLYAVTIGDSRATGPAAWNSSKAALVRDLYVKTDTLLESGVVGSRFETEQRTALETLIGVTEADDFLDAMPPGYGGAFEAAVVAHHRDLVTRRELTIEWAKPGRGLQCTIAAADRPGLLATVAGALALAGLDIESAVAYTHHDGMALEVLTGIDRFDRLSDAAGRTKASELLVGALAGELPLDDLLRERMQRYRAPANANVDRDVRILVDLDASAFTTVVEIHAPDEVGLLARIASVFADLEIDISVALVSTIGDRVIDVFYVRDADRNKLTDQLLLERLRATLLARLTTDVTLL